MLFYIALFLIIGIVIGLFISNDTVATVIILVISGIWLFVWGLWAVAAFVELCIGYGIGRWIIESTKEAIGHDRIERWDSKLKIIGELGSIIAAAGTGVTSILFLIFMMSSGDIDGFTAFIFLGYGCLAIWIAKKLFEDYKEKKRTEQVVKQIEEIENLFRDPK